MDNLGSLSAMNMMRWYLRLLMLKWSPTPQPKQFKIELIVSLLITSSKPIEAELRILPLRGSIACVANLASFAPPAAESIRNSSYRPFLWLKTIMRFDSQVLRYLKHWHVSIVSLLSNNGDGLYRLCNKYIASSHETPSYIT